MMCANALLAYIFALIAQHPLGEPCGCCHLAMRASMLLVDKYRAETPGGWLTILYLMLSVFS